MPRHPHLSSTTRSLTSTVFSSSRLAARARQRGGVFRLHVGDTYLEPIEAARAEAQRIRDYGRLHNYAPVQGDPMLLDAILERHAGAFNRDNLQVTAGATAGVGVVCQALCDVGEEVLLLAPFWPLIRGVIAVRGGVPVEVPFFDQVKRTDRDLRAVLEAAVTERTVAIYVNSPNNPTGCVLPEPAVAAIAEVARAHDLWLWSDEAYESLFFTDSPPVPIWQREEVKGRVLAIHTLSKSHGLAGARIGYVHGPAEAMRAVRAVQTFHSYCASRPMQVAGARAIREGQAWVDKTRRLYAEAARLSAEAVGVPVPQAGTFLFFDAAVHFRTGETLEGFLERCVDAGVLLMPGGHSGDAYASWVRLCFTAVPPAELCEALSRLGSVLSGSHHSA